MAVVLGEGGLRNIVEGYWVYETDGSRLQSLPVGILYKMIRYGGAAAFLKLLFLSKGSRAFLFHMLCESPEGLVVVNDLMRSVFRRAIEFYRRHDTSTREAEWRWITRQSNHIPSVFWGENYVDCMYTQYYMQSDMLCHQVFHGTYLDLYGPLRAVACRRRRVITTFTRQPAALYSYVFEGDLSEVQQAVRVSQIEQSYLDFEHALQDVCDEVRELGGPWDRRGPQLLTLTPEYVSMAEWRVLREREARVDGAVDGEVVEV